MWPVPVNRETKIVHQIDNFKVRETDSEKQNDD